MVDQDKLKKVLERVAKLRALATSQNAHEAAAAAAAAAKIIDEYRLSEAEIESAMDAKDREPVMNEQDPLITSSERSTVIAQWKHHLASYLGQHFGVYVLRDKAGRGGQDKVIITGRPSDVQVVRYFYSWLSEEVERLAKKASQELFEQTGRKGGTAYSITYKNGVVRGIGIQLQAMKRATRPTQTSTALVALDSRLEEAKKARLALYDDVRIRRAGGGWGSDLGALKKGIEDGKNVNLGHHLGAGDGKAVQGHKQLK